MLVIWPNFETQILVHSELKFGFWNYNITLYKLYNITLFLYLPYSFFLQCTPIQFIWDFRCTCNTATLSYLKFLFFRNLVCDLSTLYNLFSWIQIASRGPSPWILINSDWRNSVILAMHYAAIRWPKKS